MGKLKNRAYYTTTLPKKQIRTLRKLSAHTEIDMSKLGEEAYDDLFKKYEIDIKEIEAIEKLQENTKKEPTD